MVEFESPRGLPRVLLKDAESEFDAHYSLYFFDSRLSELRRVTPPLEIVKLNDFEKAFILAEIEERGEGCEVEL